jgi:hypothetical protein
MFSNKDKMKVPVGTCAMYPFVESMRRTDFVTFMTKGLTSTWGG